MCLNKRTYKSITLALKVFIFVFIIDHEISAQIRKGDEIAMLGMQKNRSRKTILCKTS